MSISRRRFLQSSFAVASAACLPVPGWARTKPRTLTASLASKRLVPGEEYQEATVWAFDHTVPGPMLRYQKGQTV